jgi:stearoyl-CoA desaturase (Delta-9 desaturase)
LSGPRSLELAGPETSRPTRPRLARLVRWFDGWAQSEEDLIAPGGIDWLRVLPFLAIHAGCLAVLWVGTSPFAVGLAVALYAVRMFAITAFYHRYFSHRAFRTSRAFQLLGAVLGASAVQRGPLWWASHHRLHHRRSDQPTDTHSPVQHGFLWSHIGWFLAREHFRPRLEAIGDFTRYPELRFLDRFDFVVPLCLGFSLFGLGALLERAAPGLGTSGPQLFVWGFCVSTVAVYHVTFSINSLAHRFGARPFATSDESRNHWLLALLTFGEGWHNNHHRYPPAARQGFYPGELDVSYLVLRLLARLGIVWDLKPVPERVLAEGRRP